MITKVNYLDHSSREELYWQRRALNQITCQETKLGYTSYDDGRVDFADDFPRIPSIEEIRQKANQLKQQIEDTQYQRDRVKTYPSIGDQLDMLWHAMDSGVLPKYEPFYDAIKNVKDQFPKP